MDTQTNASSQTENQLHLRPRHMKPGYKLMIGVFMALISAGLGSVLPLIGMLTMFCMFFSVMNGLIVYGLCDLLGLGAYMLVYEVCQLILGGPILAAVMLLAVVLPLFLMALLDMKRWPFFKRLYTSLGIELIGMVLALGLIVLIYRENLGDLATKALERSFEGLSANVRDTLASYYKQLYAAMGQELKYETGDQLLKAVAEVSGEYIKIGLPAMLVVLASVNVLPGVKICSSIRVGRNIPDQTSEPAAAWRMGEQTIIGLIFLIITGVILNATIGARGQVVLITVLTLAAVAATVQTIASLCDRFSHAPVGKGVKIAFGVMFALFFAQIIPYYGALSMLVGSHGLITGWIRRHRENHPGDDQPF